MKKIAVLSCMALTMQADVIVHNDMKLSYNDVLLVPKRSLESRYAVSTQTSLTYNRITGNSIRLNIPIISANMDTVTESGMAIALAQLGGIGIVHRNNTIAQQVEEICRVKRARNVVIENPVTILPSATIEQALKKMAQHEITSLLVIDQQGILGGIITSRDLRFIADERDNTT